jgi:hypothetical protein
VRAVAADDEASWRQATITAADHVCQGDLPQVAHKN